MDPRHNAPFSLFSVFIFIEYMAEKATKSMYNLHFSLNVFPSKDCAIVSVASVTESVSVTLE